MASRLSLLTVALGAGLFLADRLMGVRADADSLLTLVLASMGAMSWWLLKKRHYRSVAWLLVACLFGMAVASACFFGSVRTVNNALILLGQVAVGIFLGRRSLVWTTVGALAVLGLLTWADATHRLLGTPSFQVGWRTWLSQSACLVGVAAMMHLNRTQVRMAQQLHLREARQRVSTQQDRDQGNERFTRVFQSSPAPIFVQSARTGAILDVNTAFEKVTGYSGQAVVGKRDGFLWQRDDEHAGFVQARKSALRTGWRPLTLLCRNGRPLHTLVCSERDDDPQDGLVITALRVPEASTGALPTMLGDLYAGHSPHPGEAVDA